MIYIKYIGCLEKCSAGPTWCIWVPLYARKLVPFASSRYVLYLESTIAFLKIDYPFTKHSPHLRIRETLTRNVGVPRGWVAPRIGFFTLKSVLKPPEVKELRGSRAEFLELIIPSIGAWVVSS